MAFATLQDIIQYSSTVYRDQGGYGFLALKYHPKNQLSIYFVTFRQYRFGIDKAFPKSCYGILKILYLVEFSTD